MSILNQQSEFKKPIGDRQKLFAKCGKIKINIRRMLQKDLMEVARMEKEMFPAARHWKYDDLFAVIRTPGAGCFVATSKYDDDDILGYVIFNTSRDTSREGRRRAPGDNTAEIKTICVAKNRQQQGVGLNMLAEIVRNYKRVLAVVGEYSLKTQKFFKACGFECVKIEKEKYRYQAQGAGGNGSEWKVFDGYRFEIDS